MENIEQRSKQLAKTYEPNEVENRIYRFWMEGGYFHAVPNSGKKPYTIVIPPPNITGQLHMGHALDNTLQDILIRWRRMQGFEALWMPGTDHASIATEAKIVEAMAKEGISKEDIGREGFLKRAWEWKETYGSRIINQLKKMGSSCDWERERFTMDEGCSKAVREVFVRLYEKGLIYRGERIINWCTHCRTSISDAEVEFEEKEATFYHLRYPLTDGSGYLELATTRPETMLGDTAVAVHPDDERYAHLIGKNVILPIVNKEIPIISDTYVEMDFGTGVVKITPAHDPNDFEVGLRHNLPVVTVIDEGGIMNEFAGKYSGMTIMECRKEIVKELEEQGWLVKTEPLKHNVGSCYRCRTVIEPRISMQWFVKMEPLAGPATEAVKNRYTRFVPERFEKVYFHWLENIRDWCISRQLWWGHRIPAWYCQDCGYVTVGRDDPSVCENCGSSDIKQDEDTLDTWFSSALWPFSTLGWPDKTPELDYFYPTNTLVTGYDIIFFWVVRMMFSGLEHTGKVPFDTVFIHGLVRDAQGQKMSKSLGNGIDPLEIIEQYGADALRFTLAAGNSPGNDMRFTTEKAEASRNFANKLWNAARFILMNIGDNKVELGLPDKLELEDKWIASRFNSVAAEITENLEKFELGIAVQKLHDFIWDNFCDWYIELCKSRLQGENASGGRQVLVFVMTGTLKMLHPFMPFITEEIWQTLPHEGEALMISPWPEYDTALDFPEEEREMERIMEAIRAIRNRRAEMNVPPSKKAPVYIETAFIPTFERGAVFFEKLAWASEIKVGSGFELDRAISIVTADATIKIPMDELVDKDAERSRLTREKEAVKKRLDGVMARLNNKAFTSKAPADVVNTAKENAARLNEKLTLLEQSLLNL
ncbi:MAG: valine--tRNA ligase [Oscillospiraceae bacterium]|nr:valine--tRNA ligase [Oscillospiraceae bacterium]MDD4413341.1 valine--tRNA ligase [Oscillospiraceae bacterium]